MASIEPWIRGIVDSRVREFSDSRSVDPLLTSQCVLGSARPVGSRVDGFICSRVRRVRVFAVDELVCSRVRKARGFTSKRVHVLSGPQGPWGLRVDGFICSRVRGFAGCHVDIDDPNRLDFIVTRRFSGRQIPLRCATRRRARCRTYGRRSSECRDGISARMPRHRPIQNPDRVRRTPGKFARRR